MTVKRMDNVGIVVEDIDAAIEFFVELGLELEGRAPVQGECASRLPCCVRRTVTADSSCPASSRRLWQPIIAAPR
jgi:catechol 2,3-dioxygenase-like lactoylglutathione lyase family enzyme